MKQVLLIGDSITDCGRERSEPQSLGAGYAALIAAKLEGMQCWNRGISGDRIVDLAARWQKDCLDLKPDIVSILIGINDTWRHFDSGDATEAHSFAATYEELLQRLLEALPKVQIVLLEPFVLPFPADRQEWRADLDPKIHAVRSLAYLYAHAYVPLDGIFAAQSLGHEPGYLAEDGVHPSKAGHELIAKVWGQYTGLYGEL